MAEAKEDFAAKQHLECPACSQAYNTLAHKPKILPCGHSFCLECLGKITGSENSIICPKDRKQFSIPGGSVDSFPNNYTVLEILTNLCDDCVGQPKQQVCLKEHCSMSLCDGCGENHRQSFHSDLRAALTDLKQEATMIDDDSDIAQLEEDAEAAIAEVTKLCDKLKHNLINEIKTLKEKSMESYFEWNVAIAITATEFRVKAKKLQSRIGSIYKSDQLDKLLIDTHRQITEMKTKLAKQEDSKPTLVEFSTETPKNEFDAVLLKLLTIISPQQELTRGDSLIVQDQASGGQCASSTQQTQATTRPDYFRATLHMTYGKNGSGEGEFSEPWGISVSPLTNRVAVVDRCNHRIHLLTDSLRPVSVFGECGEGNNQYKFPHDVTITDKGVMLITDYNNHRVQATDSHGVFLYNFGSCSKYPLAIASTQDHLYICDSGKYRIKKKLHDGDYVHEFGIKLDEGKIPRFIAISEAQNKAVISDKSGNISMFSLIGGFSRFLRMIESKQPPLNIDATGLVFDKQGNLIVADNMGQQLVVLGEEDQLITTIGSGQLREPKGVALTLSGDIVVCDSSIHCVKLFKVPKVNKT